MSEDTYSAGRWLGRHWRVIAVIVAVGFGALWYNAANEREIEQARAVALQELRPKELKPPSEAELCKFKIASLQAQYEVERKAGNHWAAANVLRRCAQLTKNPQALEQVQAAEADDRWATVNDKTKSAGDRLQALESLASLDPARAQSAAGLRKSLQASFDKEVAAQKRAEAARRKREGVSIGMTKEDVIASAWGRPERINTTATSFGTREQWVYGVGNYLYFQGDRLTAIQTSDRR